MGSITGSVKEMAISNNCHQSFKKKIGLKYLVLWWTYPRSEIAGQYTQEKFSIHYEIDRGEIEESDNILYFFNYNSPKVDDIFSEH